MSRRASSHLAEEQAALRRVATLVASGAVPEEVFQSVAEEAGRLLEARTAATVRFEPDCGLIVGAWNDGEGAGIEVGTVVPYSEPGSPVNRASHEGGRIDDYTDVPGEAARLTRLAGYLSSVVAPITAGGRLWGALFVFSAQPRYFPPNAQQRLADFTQLVALALESAEAHDQLTASRARIVEASVAERRRLERNLHDGAQQRLVTLALHLRMAQERVREDPAAAEELLEGVGEDLKLALAELQELARGLHPAILTDRGLVPALQSLANRAPFPVEVSGGTPARLPEAVEAAVYYVVAESLTNAAKHAGASEAHVVLSTTTDSVTVEIRDDGSGGADVSLGSGLRGLADRVEALGGELRLESDAASGTVVRADAAASLSEPAMAGPLSSLESSCGTSRGAHRRRSPWVRRGLAPWRRCSRKSSLAPGASLEPDPRMGADGLAEALGRSNPERRRDEGGDRVAGHRRHLGERERPHAARVAEQGTTERCEVRGIVGEPQVHAPADRHQRCRGRAGSRGTCPACRCTRRSA